MVNSRALAMLQERKKWYEDRIRSLSGIPQDRMLVRSLKEGAEMCEIALQAIMRCCAIDGEEIIPMDGSNFPSISESMAENVFSL